MTGVQTCALPISVERVLGKDEVTSSNLVSSSKKSLEISRFRGFFSFFLPFHFCPVGGKSPFDYYLTTTGLLKQYPLCVTTQGLFGLEHGFQRIGGLPVPLLEGVGVDVHSGGGLGVSQPLGYGF